MTESAPVSQELNQDVLCIACGYNLRGLDISGRCPECALPIADSNRSDSLRFADPRWLKKLRFGATLKLWNLLVGMLVGGGTGLIVAIGFNAVWAVFLAAIGSLFGLLATFAITTQEPKTTLTEDPVTLRKIIRICAVVAFVGLVVQQIEGSSRLAAGAGLTPPKAFWLFLGLLVPSAALLVQIGELKYFRRFALRVPDLQLARSTRILMWGLGITYGLTAVGGAAIVWVVSTTMGAGGATTTTTVSPLGAGGSTMTLTTTAPAGASPLTGTTAGLAAGACVLGLGYTIFGLWYIVLLFRYRKAIHNAAMLATGKLVI